MAGRTYTQDDFESLERDLDSLVERVVDLAMERGRRELGDKASNTPKNPTPLVEWFVRRYLHRYT